MKKIFLANVTLLLLVVLSPAQSDGDRCHVYVVDVARAKKALEETRNGGSDQSDSNALSIGQTVFPEFRTVLGEEELTTKSYRFPGSKLMITASVFYTDESMASSESQDSMMLGIVVSPKAHSNALSKPNNALVEITLKGSDTVRAKQYVQVRGRSYLVGLECRRKEKKSPE